MSTPENNSENYIIERSVTLGAIEVFLGSFLHLFKIPFTGHFLSLNQGAYLTRIARLKENRINSAKSMVQISMVVSMMKALAPTTKKLGPMISILMQGWLYSFGFLLGAGTVVGQMLGLGLLSLWAFVQPLVTFFIMYGVDLKEAFVFFVNKLHEQFNVSEELLWLSFASLVLVKVIIAICIPLVFKIYGDSPYERLEFFLVKFGNQKKREEVRTLSTIQVTFKDLLRPSIVLSFILMGLFFKFNGTEASEIIWRIFRAASIAFLLFYLGRSPQFSKVIDLIAARSARFQKFVMTSKIALNEMRSRL